MTSHDLTHTDYGEDSGLEAVMGVVHCAKMPIETIVFYLFLLCRPIYMPKTLGTTKSYPKYPADLIMA